MPELPRSRERVQNMNMFRDGSESAMLSEYVISLRPRRLEPDRSPLGRRRCQSGIFSQCSASPRRTLATDIDPVPRIGYHLHCPTQSPSQWSYHHGMIGILSTARSPPSFPQLWFVGQTRQMGESSRQKSMRTGKYLEIPNCRTANYRCSYAQNARLQVITRGGAAGPSSRR